MDNITTENRLTDVIQSIDEMDQKDFFEVIREEPAYRTEEEMLDALEALGIPRDQAPHVALSFLMSHDTPDVEKWAKIHYAKLLSRAA